ncbi:MAG: hypothetical protein NTY23_08135 [Chloroflexi bacterium]|nr:hypothetical protein [Chloroflexota bacterium]
MAKVLIAYVLPGFAAQSIVRLKGLGWGGRVVLAVSLSVVGIPYVFVAVGNFLPFRPSLMHVVIMSLVLLAVGFLLRVIKKSPLVEFRPRNGGAWPPSRAEWILACGFVLGFAALVSLPRLEMFVHGNQANVAATWDEYWHIAELTSVARSGIPPHHYFFPDSSLVYYYWSWVLPAALANQFLGQVSLARALAIHGYIQVAMFLGLAYVLTRANTRSWLGRTMGMGFFSFVGGFDYFATMGQEIEWWQVSVRWLRSGIQFSSFPTLYAWVPQHVAGGFAFLLGLVMWRHLRANWWIKAACLGWLLAFAFGTSAFVALFSLVALVIWVLMYRRVFRSWKAVAIAAATVGFLAVGAWGQVLLTMSHSGQIGLSDFRVPFVEIFYGISSGKADLVDRFLTLFAFPVVGTWLMLIEYGLMFAIFLSWLLWRGWRERSVWFRFGAVFPIVSLVLVFHLRDRGGGGNFAMRGFIPAQIIMAVVAAHAVDAWPLAKMRLGIRVLFGYLLLTVFLVGGISWGLDLQQLARDPVGSALHVNGVVKFLRVNIAAEPAWPRELEYIHWLNANTPEDSLIVESGPLPKDNPRFRMLERMRFISVSDAKNLAYGDYDLDFAPANLAEETSRGDDEIDVLEQAMRSNYTQSTRPLIFLVARGGRYDGVGALVYEDEYVTVYSIARE